MSTAKMPTCIRRFRLIDNHKFALDAMLVLDSRIDIMLVAESSKLSRRLIMSGHKKESISDLGGCSGRCDADARLSVRRLSEILSYDWLRESRQVKHRPSFSNVRGSHTRCDAPQKDRCSRVKSVAQSADFF